MENNNQKKEILIRKDKIISYDSQNCYVNDNIQTSTEPEQPFMPEEMANKEIVKCMYIDEPEILDAAIAKLPPELAEKYTLVKSAPFYLEIVKKTVNKGAAVLHLAEKLGLSKEETMAIGDEENDRAMLEAVGSPVVMENGKEELKRIAKYITKSNDESGVAHAIREWVLK